MIHPAPVGALLALALAPGARAEVVVGPPVTIATQGTSPALAVAADGAATLAWAGRGHDRDQPPNGTEGLFASDRGAGGTWSPAAKVAHGNAAFVSLAGGSRRALLWLRWQEPGETAKDQILLSVAAPGAGFAAPETVATIESSGAAPRPTSVAVLGDGTVIAGLHYHDPAVPHGTAQVAERSPAGVMSAPKLVGSGILHGPQIAVAGDRAIAMWSGVEPGGSGSGPRRIYVSERASDGTWSAPQALSDAARDADNGAAAPELVGNARGDAVVVWNSGTPSTGFPGFPDRVEASYRPAGGAWGVAQTLSAQGTSGFRPSIALGSGGAAGVVWNAPPGVAAAFAPSGGAFSERAPLAVQGGQIERLPVAVDGAGQTVVAARSGFDTSARLLLFSRQPSGTCFNARAELAATGTQPDSGIVRLRGDGSGVAAWLEIAGQTFAVRAADLRSDDAAEPQACPAPPAPPAPAPMQDPGTSPPAISLGRLARKISRVELTRRGIRVALTVDRAAKVDILVLGKRSGKDVVVARRRFASARAQTFRLKVSRRALDRVSTSRPLTLLAAAHDDAGATTARATFRVTRSRRQ